MSRQLGLAPAIPVNLNFPPPPTAPFPKPKTRFPLRTAHKQRPSLELVTNPIAPAKMPSPPRSGALGATFTISRAAQFASLIAVIGLCANFISIVAAADHNPPSELIGTLTMAITAVIYTVITYILYYDGMLSLLVTGCLDGLLLIAFIVVASLVGKPLPRVNCAARSGTSPLDSGIWIITPSSTLLRSSVLPKTIPYPTFVALDKATCHQSKAVWALGITLCILFAFSALVCIALWHRHRRDGATPSKTKDIEG
jgi:hypothetical protein